MRGCQFEPGPGHFNPQLSDGFRRGTVRVNAIMRQHVARRRKPLKPPANWCRNVAFQLALIAEISDNYSQTGANGAVTPPPPNQDGGTSSTMTTANYTATPPSPRKTYPQDWPAYNAAQTSEKDTFMALLADLCSGVSQPEYSFGRPRLPVADMVYTGALKVYVGFSARRFDSDVREAQRKGYITTAPSFNSVNRYIADPNLTPVIMDLIEQSAGPLSVVESQVAVDSSGFSTCRFDRWFDAKWGKEKSKRKWLKAHIAVGVKTNIVTAVEVTPSTVHDSQVMPRLLDRTSQRFDIAEVSADKAYLSDANLRYIEGLGAYPYIPFKSNTTGLGSPMWRRLYAYFTLNEEAFNVHYHRRSNVETVFSMIKGKFGDAVRAKSETGQVNEILLKCLCHNICVLVHAMHELELSPLHLGRN